MKALDLYLKCNKLIVYIEEMPDFCSMEQYALEDILEEMTGYRTCQWYPPLDDKDIEELTKSLGVHKDNFNEQDIEDRLNKIKLDIQERELDRDKVGSIGLYWKLMFEDVRAALIVYDTKHREFMQVVSRHYTSNNKASAIIRFSKNKKYQYTDGDVKQLNDVLNTEYTALFMIATLDIVHYELSKLPLEDLIYNRVEEYKDVITKYQEFSCAALESIICGASVWLLRESKFRSIYKSGHYPDRPLEIELLEGLEGFNCDKQTIHKLEMIGINEYHELKFDTALRIQLIKLVLQDYVGSSNRSQSKKLNKRQLLKEIIESETEPDFSDYKYALSKYATIILGNTGTRVLKRLNILALSNVDVDDAFNISRSGDKYYKWVLLECPKDKRTPEQARLMKEYGTEIYVDFNESFIKQMILGK